MNKEYEEAQEQIYCWLEEMQGSTKPEHHPNIVTNKILSLKGENWQIALVKNDMSGVGKPNFKHVIWRAE